MKTVVGVLYVSDDVQILRIYETIKGTLAVPETTGYSWHAVYYYYGPYWHIHEMFDIIKDKPTQSIQYYEEFIPAKKTWYIERYISDHPANPEVAAYIFNMPHITFKYGKNGDNKFCACDLSTGHMIGFIQALSETNYQSVNILGIVPQCQKYSAHIIQDLIDTMHKEYIWNPIYFEPTAGSTNLKWFIDELPKEFQITSKYQLLLYAI